MVSWLVWGLKPCFSWTMSLRWIEKIPFCFKLSPALFFDCLVFPPSFSPLVLLIPTFAPALLTLPVFWRVG